MMREDLAIWLYGSHARGDADFLSDMDIFVASDDELSIDELASYIPSLPKEIAVSKYNWSEIKEMAEYGSLFLQHLRLEGYAIWESNSRKRRLAAILSRMGEYKHVKRDISGFQTVIGDIQDSLNDGGSPVFELSVLSTIIRHSSILGCWIDGNPSFGRVEPVMRYVKSHGLCSSIAAEFPALYKYRLYIDGKIPSVNELVPYEVDIWLERTSEIIETLEGDCHGN